MLVVIVLGLLTQLAVDSTALDENAVNAAIHESEELQALTVATQPLRGIDKRVADTGKQMETFYMQRIPANYSSISARIGELEAQSGVRLSHVGYAQRPRGPELTEISIDCGVSGQYPQIMRFVNGLERDQMFFVIRAMTFQGQQGGSVNLQLRVSTWLGTADITASKLPMATERQDQGRSVDRRQ